MLSNRELQDFIELCYGRKIDNLSTNMCSQPTLCSNNGNSGNTDNTIQILWDDVIDHYEYLQKNKINLNEEMIILKEFINRLELLDIDTTYIKNQLNIKDFKVTDVMSAICNAIVD